MRETVGDGTVEERDKKLDQLATAIHSLCSLMSTILLLVTVMLMALTLTVAVHVYCPASEVLREFKKSVTVLLVLTASTLVLFRAESPLTCFVHMISGRKSNPSNTPTIQVRVREDPSDILPLEVVITVGGGRAELEDIIIHA